MYTIHNRKADTQECLKILVDDFHQTIVATIGADGHPVTRSIDMSYYDDKGVYFITGMFKEFYKQLMEQKYVSVSAVDKNRNVTLSGYVENIGQDHLKEIFEKNPYLQPLYTPEDRKSLNVFRIKNAKGTILDISDPDNVTRSSFVIGD